MNAIACFAVISLILQTGLPAQTGFCCIVAPEPHRVHVSPELAEKMLIQRADLVCPHAVMPARVTGTVVVKVLVGTNGNILHAKVISCPLMLQRPVVDAVRKYKFQPYLLNNKAVEVVSTVSVVVDSYRDCHIE